MIRNRIGRALGVLGFAAVLVYATAAGLTGSPSLGNQAFAQAKEAPSDTVRWHRGEVPRTGG